MQIHNSDDTIHIPPENFFEDLLDQVNRLQTQVDELKRLHYSNSSDTSFYMVVKWLVVSILIQRGMFYQNYMKMILWF